MIYLRLLIIGGAFAAGALVAHWYYQSSMADHYEEALRAQRAEFETVLSDYADRINEEARRSTALSKQVKGLRESNADLQEEIANATFTTETDDSCTTHPASSPEFYSMYQSTAENGPAETGDRRPE